MRTAFGHPDHSINHNGIHGANPKPTLSRQASEKSDKSEDKLSRQASEEKGDQSTKHDPQVMSSVAKLLKKDVLCLLIVDMPSEKELEQTRTMVDAEALE